MTRSSTLVSFSIIGLLALLLAGCVAPTPQVIAATPQVIMQGDTPGKEEVQPIELDNCNGKADTKRIEQRTRSIESTISAEIAAKFGASAEVLSAEVQAAVGAAMKWGAERSTSIELVAPPGTRMAFQLVWIGDEQVGIVQNLRASNIPIAFRSFKPTDVRIKSQYDIGCPPTPVPGSTLAAETQRPPSSTPVASVPNFGNNMVLNGYFEAGMNAGGWEWGGSVSEESGHNSNKAICSLQTTPASQAVSWVGVAQFINVVSGQEYSLTAWLNWSDAAQAHMKILWFDSGFKQLQENHLMSGTDGTSNGWVQRGGTVIAPSGATQARVIFWHGVKNGVTNVLNSKLCVDDVVFASR